MKRFVCSSVVGAVFAFTPVRPCLAQLPDSLARDVALPAQDFTFWVGEWRVTLSTLQADGTWLGSEVANAMVYPVLGTKAIVELWDAPTIKGFSILYHDASQNAWVVWLNWPGQDRSGSSSLQGNFHHGRGEFFTTSRNDSGGETLVRYTFSDITRTTLRWDDAYSRDGGQTWSPNWIMEFVRMAVEPRFVGDGGPAHTYLDGARCTLPEFRSYEFLAGPWVGTAMDTRERPVAVTGYQILDGCALLLFAGRTGRPESASRFAHLTWNTARSAFELLTLAADSLAPATRLFGEMIEGGFAFHDGEDESGATYRVRIERLEEDRVHWLEERRTSDGWTVAWQATLDRWSPGRAEP